MKLNWRTVNVSERESGGEGERNNRQERKFVISIFCRFYEKMNRLGTRSTSTKSARVIFWSIEKMTKDVADWRRIRRKLNVLQDKYIGFKRSVREVISKRCSSELFILKIQLPSLWWKTCVHMALCIYLKLYCLCSTLCVWSCYTSDGWLGELHS